MLTSKILPWKEYAKSSSEGAAAAATFKPGQSQSKNEPRPILAPFVYRLLRPFPNEADEVFRKRCLRAAIKERRGVVRPERGEKENSREGMDFVLGDAEVSQDLQRKPAGPLWAFPLNNSGASIAKVGRSASAQVGRDSVAQRVVLLGIAKDPPARPRAKKY